MTKKEEIRDLINSFAGNKLLFPSTWGDETIISDSLVFKSYFNDNRDYCVFKFIIDGEHFEITCHDDGFNVLHPIGRPFTTNKAIKLLKQVKLYFSDPFIQEDEEMKRIERQSRIKTQIRELKKELKELD